MGSIQLLQSGPMTLAALPSIAASLSQQCSGWHRVAGERQGHSATTGTTSRRIPTAGEGPPATSQRIGSRARPFSCLRNLLVFPCRVFPPLPPPPLLASQLRRAGGGVIFQGRVSTRPPDSLPLSGLSGSQRSPSLSVGERAEDCGISGVLHTWEKCTAIQVRGGRESGPASHGRYSSLPQEVSWTSIQYSFCVRASAFLPAQISCWLH